MEWYVMKNIINDLFAFIKSLSFVDIVFIVSIIGLLILIVTLLYIIKINDEDELDYLDEELDLEHIKKEKGSWHYSNPIEQPNERQNTRNKHLPIRERHTEA